MKEHEYYKIKKETVEKWLVELFRISGAETIENAITLSKMMASGEALEIANAVSVIYRAECSGEIDPPIRIRELYAEISAQGEH